MTNDEKAVTIPPEKEELTVEYMIDDNKIKLTPSIVQRFIVGNDNKISLVEFKMFTELCKVRKLNPFLKEVYLIKYGDSPATIVVGKDAILRRAEQHPQYDGKESGVITKTKDGVYKKREGSFVPEEETLVGGWAKVYRKDRSHPEVVTVSLKEVSSKDRGGNPTRSWASMPATMIEKVAKVRALREAFPEQFSGMYDETEVQVPPTSKNAPTPPWDETPFVDTNEGNTEPDEKKEPKKISLNDV